jgi:hypothetical protein
MTTVDIKEFARDVERLCDFLIDKLKQSGTRDDSEDLRVIDNLKEIAADIQFDKVNVVTETLSGLSAYMKGASTP